MSGSTAPTRRPVKAASVSTVASGTVGGIDFCDFDMEIESCRELEEEGDEEEELVSEPRSKALKAALRKTEE